MQIVTASKTIFSSSVPPRPDFLRMDLHLTLEHFLASDDVKHSLLTTSEAIRKELRDTLQKQVLPQLVTDLSHKAGVALFYPPGACLETQIMINNQPENLLKIADVISVNRLRLEMSTVADVPVHPFVTLNANRDKIADAISLNVIGGLYYSFFKTLPSGPLRSRFVVRSTSGAR